MTSSLKRAWYRWKSLRLPWRRQFLVGFDLSNNTFWEFKDHINTNRMRRIIRYSHPTHFSDIKISPQWHQWLRHVRETPPSLNEQRAELVRQEQMKQLAARADARWASKPSFLDSPAKGQPSPTTMPRDQGEYGGVDLGNEGKEGVRNAVAGAEGLADSKEIKAAKEEAKEKGKDPWEQAKRARGGPSEDWQPTAWSPTSKRAQR
ncbi:MAG: hypothetical protein M1819_006518 [Sarea resinae]|nr:MAG: hypothetical protein M1819_000610 [Sarea resinae]KAI9828811.1 MAG: hypothetical protein M1819_006518 [Sarea resinae]